MHININSSCFHLKSMSNDITHLVADPIMNYLNLQRRQCCDEGRLNPLTRTYVHSIDQLCI